MYLVYAQEALVYNIVSDVYVSDFMIYLLSEWKTPSRPRIHLSGHCISGHNSPAESARELFKSSPHSASLAGSIKKKLFDLG